MVPGGYWYPPSATSRANDVTSCGSWCSALETHGFWRGKHHPQGTPKRWFCMKKIKDEARCAYLSKQLWKYIYRHPLMVRRITFRTYISDHFGSNLWSRHQRLDYLTHQRASIHQWPSMVEISHDIPWCAHVVFPCISIIVSYIHGIFPMEPDTSKGLNPPDHHTSVVLPQISSLPQNLADWIHWVCYMFFSSGLFPDHQPQEDLSFVPASAGVVEKVRSHGVGGLPWFPKTWRSGKDISLIAFW